MNSSSKIIVAVIGIVLFALVVIAGFWLLQEDNANEDDTELAALNTRGSISNNNNLELNDLCEELINSEAIAELSGDAQITISSPNNTDLLACEFESTIVIATVQALKGSDAQDTYNLNVESIAVDTISGLNSLNSEELTGFYFDNGIVVDAFGNDIWVNVSLDTSRGENYQEEFATTIVDEVIANL